MGEHGRTQPSSGPATLWHYTTAQGLLGILEHDCIWASGINFLNDATENRKAKQLLRDNISKRIDSASDADYKKVNGLLREASKEAPEVSAEHYFERLREILASKVWDQSENNIFVACFSKWPDSLSQWRAYTTVGSGYAIGFERTSLAQLYAYPETKQAKTFVRRKLSAVEYYSKDIHDQSFDAVADALIVRFLSESNAEYWINVLLGDVSPFFKDGSFSEEGEWRLVCLGNIDYVSLELRPGRSHLIPYITISLKDIPNAIQTIMVGPGPNVDRDVRALQTLMDARHMDIEITKSNIPFRNW